MQTFRALSYISYPIGFHYDKVKELLLGTVL